MSDPVLPPRESITIVRGESNGPLYLLVGLIALGAVGIAYWVATSDWHPGPASTTTVIMAAPTAGPVATPRDVGHRPDRPAPDSRPRDTAPAQDSQVPPPMPIQPAH